jgi:TRAP transporter TAXI family solute receptor
MIKKITLAFLILANILSAKSIITAGSPNGTYISIAQEIASLVAKNIGLNLEVLESTGSIQNIKNMVENGDVKFAIVQHDIMEYLKRSKKSQYQKLSRDIRVLLPLYMEKLHIVVNRDSDIRYFRDIEDKKLAIGTKGSGTSLTTLIIYEKAFGKGSLRSDITDRSPLSEALDKLDRGEVDVVFAVGAEPILALDRDKRYRLIEIRDKTLLSNYYSSKIRRGTYDWLDRDVKVAGVASFLVCNTQNRVSRRKLIEFGKEFKRRLPYLKRVGHRKWQKVKNHLLALPRDWDYCREFKRGWESVFHQGERIINNTQPEDGCSEQERILKLCGD